MKSIWIIIIVLVIAGVGYFAYTGGYFGGQAQDDTQGSASLDLSVDGTSGFGEE